MYIELSSSIFCRRYWSRGIINYGFSLTLLCSTTSSSLSCLRSKFILLSYNLYPNHLFILLFYLFLYQDIPYNYSIQPLSQLLQLYSIIYNNIESCNEFQNREKEIANPELMFFLYPGVPEEIVL